MEDNKTAYNIFFRQVLFLLVLIAIGAVIFFQLDFFLGSFLGASTLYIVLRRPFYYLIKQKNWGNVSASLIIVLFTAIVLIAIGIGVFDLLYSRFVTADLSSLFDGVKVISDKIYELTGYHIIPHDIIVQSKSILMGILSEFINVTYSVAVNVFMMFVLLYFMLANAQSMERTLLSYMPFKGSDLDKIKIEVKGMVLSNALGIPLIMLAQGIVAGVGYSILGVPDAIFWGFITGLFSIVPMVGTMLIWLPTSVYLFATGFVWQGIVLALYGAVIIGNADNVIRFVLLKKAANVHPLITIFGVILGIPLFGFWGIIFGPLLISGFLLLIRIYYAEFSSKTNGQTQ